MSGDNVCADKMDRRVLKTKRSIHNAFAKLLTKKLVNDITVTDIANEADINRKTFYRYYSGIYDLIDDIEEKFISESIKELERIDFEQVYKDPSYFLFQLGNILDDNSAFYTHLFHKDIQLSLINKMTKVIKEKSIAYFIERGNDEDTAILVNEYCVSGMCAIFSYWFNSDKHISTKKLSKTIHNITSGIIKEIDIK
jgi:Transcriptional regulator